MTAQANVATSDLSILQHTQYRKRNIEKTYTLERSNILT